MSRKNGTHLGLLESIGEQGEMSLKGASVLSEKSRLVSKSDQQDGDWIVDPDLNQQTGKSLSFLIQMGIWSFNILVGILAGHGYHDPSGTCFVFWIVILKKIFYTSMICFILCSWFYTALAKWIYLSNIEMFYDDQLYGTKSALYYIIEIINDHSLFGRCNVKVIYNLIFGKFSGLPVETNQQKLSIISSG